MAEDRVNRVWVSVERGGYSHGQLIKSFFGGDTVEEVTGHLTAAFGSAAADNIIGHVAALGVEEAFDNIKAGGLVGSSTPKQDNSAPAGPVCDHGPRVIKSGIGKNGARWQAWMCPAPKGDPSQCKPEWV